MKTPATQSARAPAAAALPTGDRAPTAAEIEALPTPEQAVAFKTVEECAEAIGRCAVLLKRYEADLLSRRLLAAMALKEQHDWQAAHIYRLIDVPRRTYTAWYQRVEETGRDIPLMSEAAARAELVGTNNALHKWQPTLDEFVKLRTSMYRTLMVSGRTDREIRKMLHLTRDQSRTERKRAIETGATPPERNPSWIRVYNLIIERIEARQPGYTGQLPGEFTLAAELTREWGWRVDRSAVTTAYQRLALTGLIYPVRRVGWFLGSPVGKLRPTPTPERVDDPADLPKRAAGM